MNNYIDNRVQRKKGYEIIYDEKDLCGLHFSTQFCGNDVIIFARQYSVGVTKAMMNHKDVTPYDDSTK